MTQGDWFILMGMGGGFIILGLIGILWGRHEEKSLFKALAEKPDLREFSLRHVESPQPGALKIGGWIAVAVGALLLVVGIILWLLA